MAGRVVIRPASLGDEREFLLAVARSRSLHAPWVRPPATSEAFRHYLTKRQEPRGAAFFVWTDAMHGLVGAINLDEIVHGIFLSAYLGYYAFEPYAGQGLMRDGLSQVIDHAFGTMRLHRLEANIQPGNRASKSLVKGLGFRREGFSPRYLKIGGRWRDHERWALLREDW